MLSQSTVEPQDPFPPGQNGTHENYPPDLCASYPHTMTTTLNPNLGPDIRVVDVQPPAVSWGRKVVFHHTGVRSDSGPPTRQHNTTRAEERAPCLFTPTTPIPG